MSNFPLRKILFLDEEQLTNILHAIDPNIEILEVKPLRLGTVSE